MIIAVKTAQRDTVVYTTQYEIVVEFPTKPSWPLIIYFSFMHDAVRFNQNIGVHQNHVLTKHKCVFLDIKRRRTP